MSRLSQSTLGRLFPIGVRSLARLSRALPLALALAFVIAASGCATPGAIGVQDFGTIEGRIVDARTNAPIGGALVSVGSLYTVKSDPSGTFDLMAPTGDQMVSVYANGYVSPSPITVTVVKDQAVNVQASAIALQPVNP